MNSSKMFDISLPRDEISKNFGGGIPANSIFLVEGVDGAGKSIIAQRLAYGALQHGATVSYISTELDTQSFVDQMNSVNYKITNDLLKGNLIFLPMFPAFGRSKLRSNFVESLLKAEVIFDQDVIIFDTFSYLILQENMSREDIFEFINKLRKIIMRGKVVVFTVDTEQVNQTFLKLIRGMSDIYINMDIQMSLGELIRVINIKRYKRSTSASSSAIPFSVEPGTGILIKIVSLS